MSEKEGVSRVECKKVLSFSVVCGCKECDREALRIDINRTDNEVSICYERWDGVRVKKAKLSETYAEILIELLRQQDIGQAYKLLSDIKNLCFCQGARKIYYPLEEALSDFCEECNCAYCDKHHNSRIVENVTYRGCPKGHEQRQYGY